jgi:predicted 2-oxoglutarate/Fe(II)-dependent dioxygenase YbiX|tara:strand:- start:281 stop:844 length:564 start_codon:yes stop_codon:yes gene_type:complete
MTSNVEDFIFIKQIIPKDFCKEVVDKIKNLHWQKMQWYKLNENTYKKPTETDLETIFATTEQHKLLEPFIEKAVQEYQDLQNINPLRQKFLHHLSTLRFNRYKPNTNLKPHYDLIKDIWPRGDYGVPIVSIVGNLNSDYEGGDFYIRNNKYELKEGDIMLFPSTFIFNHEVKTVTKGERYSFVSWAY